MFKRSKEPEKKGSEKREYLLVSFLKDAHFVFAIIFHSLNYEMLTGDKAGIESVRVNNQYRIEFKTSKVVSEIVVTVCNILELSNHYK